MQIYVAGAGAVGCHYGSKLLQAGHKVTFLARGAHLRALREHGLVHESMGQRLVLPVEATDDPSTAVGADWILLTCKMTSLAPMLASLKEHVRPDALVLTLQNGVDAPPMAAEAFPGRCVLAGCAFIGARLASPGYVIHSAAGGIRMGVWRKGSARIDVEQAAQIFRDAGVDVRVEKDVLTMLWRKMLWNCGFNALTAILRRYAHECVADPDCCWIVRRAMEEALQAALQQGAKLAVEDIEKHLRVTASMGPVMTSMWQDIEAGRPTEVDFINGKVAQLVPQALVNRMLTSLVHALQRVSIDREGECLV